MSSACPSAPISSSMCFCCRLSIPEGVSSVLFQNRNFHFKCYVCSHCRSSLMDTSVFFLQNDLLCADCHLIKQRQNA
jgi:hypothetical protein